MIPKLYSHPINLQKLTCITCPLISKRKRNRNPSIIFQGFSLSNSLYYDFLSTSIMPFFFAKTVGVWREPGARPLLQHSQLLHWSSPMNPKVSNSLQEPTDRWNWWALQCRRSWDFFPPGSRIHIFWVRGGFATSVRRHIYFSMGSRQSPSFYW